MRTARNSARLADEAESEIRVFFASAQRTPLAPQIIDRALLFGMVDSLRSLTKDDPAKTRTVVAISAALKRWNDEFATPVIAGHIEHQTALAEQQLYDGVQARFDDFIVAGRIELGQRESRVRRAQLIGTAAVLAELFAFLAILLFIIRGTLMRDARDLTRQHGLLQRQAVDLEEKTVELEAKVEEMESVNTSLKMAVTETARKDKELQTSLERRDEAAAFLDSALASSPVGFAFWDSDLRYIRITHQLASAHGFSPDDFVGRTIAEILPAIETQVQPILEQVLRTRVAVSDVKMVIDGRDSGGHVLHRLVTYYPVVTCGGKFLAVGAAISDVTESHLREEALRRSEERYRYVSLATNDAVWDWDLKTGTIEWNDGVSDLFGYDLNEVSPDVTWWAERVHPDDNVEVMESLETLIAGRDSQWIREYRFRRKDGKYSTVHDKGYVLRDTNGTAKRIMGAMADRTKQQNLELQLRQSQKMEAIGRLAGGVAHDFNNILTVISMSSEFLLEGAVETDDKYHDAQEIKKAADRAARLTRQLLAFSRQQVLNPRVISVNEAIDGMHGMLQRVVRENIELIADLSPVLGMVKADSGQIEQVLLNLAINASDAMPAGGKLVIRTDNTEVDTTFRNLHTEVQRGSYVCILVSDTGTGMDKDTISRIFEPFFTTKGVGKGTGLGLATVHGIVTQSNGKIWVYSELGQGTTFKIFLPRVDGVPERAAAEPRKTLVASVNETILLVEDEEPTREAICRILAREGYNVLQARTGVHALQVAQAHEGDIHFLLTDSMMPEMGGGELIPRLRKLRKNIRVLMMSGYTEEIARADLDESQHGFIEKPFTTVGLLNRIRQMLN
jgi:PAS domain S-box-containing protein